MDIFDNTSDTIRSGEPSQTRVYTQPSTQASPAPPVKSWGGSMQVICFTPMAFLSLVEFFATCLRRIGSLVGPRVSRLKDFLILSLTCPVGLGPVSSRAPTNTYNRNPLFGGAAFGSASAVP